MGYGVSWEHAHGTAMLGNAVLNDQFAPADMQRVPETFAGAGLGWLMVASPAVSAQRTASACELRAELDF